MASLANTAAEPKPDTADEYIRPFDIFGLPREFRDMIYCQRGLCDGVLYQQPTSTRFKTTVRKSNTSMLLVSHQFAHEYRESAHHQVIVLAEDHPWFPNVGAPQPFGRMNDVDHLETRLIVMTEAEMNSHPRWLASWSAHAIELRSISVEFYVDRESDPGFGSEYAKRMFVAINGKCKLRRLRVIYTPDPCHQAGEIMLTERTVTRLVDWESDDGPVLELAAKSELVDSLDQSSTTLGKSFGDDVLEASGQDAGINAQKDNSQNDEDSEDEDTAAYDPEHEHDDKIPHAGAGVSNHEGTTPETASMNAMKAELRKKPTTMSLMASTTMVMQGPGMATAITKAPDQRRSTGTTVMIVTTRMKTTTNQTPRISNATQYSPTPPTTSTSSASRAKSAT